MWPEDEIGGNNINNLNEKEILKYGSDFDDKSFWSKLKLNAGKIGEEGVYLTLLLYYALKTNIPVSIKMLIIASIGYLLCPVDVVPDWIPIAGYADDIAVLCYTKYKIEEYLDADVQEEARKKLEELKGAIG